MTSTVARIAMLLGCLSVPGVAMAADQKPELPLDAKVTLRPQGSSSSRLSFRTEVIDYNAQGLIIKTRSGERRRYAAEEVISVEPVLSVAHREGDGLFERRQWRDAIARYRDALRDEGHPQRAWVRRRILAQMVRAFRGVGDLATAGDTFLALYDGEPETLHFEVIPLQWITRATGEQLRLRAQHWMRQGADPASRLLGASHLLTTSQRSEALAVLEQELSGVLDGRIRVLARAQVWRTRVATADVHEVDGWRREIEGMPEALRGGPYYVLGEAYARLGDPQAAALAYLWVPLVYDEDRELAGRALLGAARALEKLGQRSEAITLIAEVRERFAETDAAREAAGVLREPAGVSQTVR